MKASPLFLVTTIPIPRSLVAAHKSAWPAPISEPWTIDTYSLPAHPLTDAIDTALGMRGQGVGCGYARLHADTNPCWQGQRFLSLVITGDHYIDAATASKGLGGTDAVSVRAIPGAMFLLHPFSWHCAIPSGEERARLLRLAQWEVSTRKLGAAIGALRSLLPEDDA